MHGASQVADVNGTRLVYDIAGAGPPLVLIHGFSLDRRMWDEQVDAFAARHQVIRYDVRGFGQSGPPTTAPYADVDDLRALLDHLSIDRARVLGLSMGGDIAVDFALTYPERTHALIVVDAAINGWPWSAAWHTQWELIPAAACTAGPAAGTARWLAHPLFAPANERPAVAARLRAIVGDFSGWHWLNKSGQASPRPPAMQRLGDIAAPTLIVVGERDLPDFHACAARMVEAIPDARLVGIPGTGHMANMEEPAVFNHQVLDFLAAR